MENSLVREYFDGKSVFITGGTGFVGKVLVEKLLRYCERVDKIYLLIRNKNGKSVEKRLKDLLHSKLFSFAIDIEKVGHKVIPISGDLSLPNMGLTESDRKLLTESVSIIIHVAGDVKFNETLRDSIAHNLIGAKLILDLCKDMQKLEALVHTSTTYAFCQNRELEEKVYPIITTPEEVIYALKIMNDNQLEKYAMPLMEGRPNPYTFAKALAEHLVLNDRGDIPTAIVRPSIVTSTFEEPVPGWIDNFNGAVAIGILGYLGIMRICDFEADSRISFVPVDYTCNALIASAWFVATHKPKDVQIYNITSHPHSTPSLIDVIKTTRDVHSKMPSMKVVRPAAGIPKTRPSKLRLWLTMLISHYLFAYCVDAVLWIIRYKPIMVSVTQRMHSGFTMLSYFWMHSWDFHTHNTKYLMNVLKDESPFDAHNLKMNVSLVFVDWRQYIENTILGSRRYLLKEPDENIPLAKKRLKKIVMSYRLFLFFWYSILAYGFYWIIFRLSTSILY